MVMLSFVVALSLMTAFANAESILMTEVFVIPIRPETFDWSGDARTDQFSYQPSLLNAPDLPSWIHYTYSKRDHHGFLYGVAPKDRKYFQVIHRGEMSDTCFELSLLFNLVTFKFNILFLYRNLRLILLLIVV